MVKTHEMIQSHPISAVRAGLIECLQACADCAQVCSLCADACLSEPTVGNLTHCIGVNLDCATICEATEHVLARQGTGEASMITAQIKACLEACRVCAEECERHGGMLEHCAVCAAECRRCEQACRKLLDQI